MIQRETIGRYPGSLSDLADEVGDLRYDALAGFLRALAVKVDRDGVADAGRQRPKLAAALREAGSNIAAAARDVEQAWSICGPRMGADVAPRAGAGPGLSSG